MRSIREELNQAVRDARTQAEIAAEREANRGAGRLSWQREGCVCKVQDSPDPACPVCSGGAS